MSRSSLVFLKREILTPKSLRAQERREQEPGRRGRGADSESGRLEHGGGRGDGEADGVYRGDGKGGGGRGADGGDGEDGGVEADWGVEGEDGDVRRGLDGMIWREGTDRDGVGQDSDVGKRICSCAMRTR